MTTPKTWTFRDAVPAAELNKISTSLTEAHTLLGDAGLNPLCRKSSEATFYMRHTHRFLHFASSGKIKDPSGIGEDVGISEDSDTGHGVHDLESVSWLTYGMLYLVSGVSCCVEHWEG